MPTCTECSTHLSPPADAVEGEIVPCPQCGAELEIIGLDPVAVAPAPEVEEDWGE